MFTQGNSIFIYHRGWVFELIYLDKAEYIRGAGIMANRRAVVTGLGFTTCHGSLLNDSWSGIRSGIAGLSKLQGQEWSNLPCQIGGVIPDKEHVFRNFSKSDLREKSKAIIYALYAARCAMDDATLGTSTNPHRKGVSVGIGMPDLSEIYQAGHDLNVKGVRGLSPYFIPRNLVNMAAGHISMDQHLQGPNLTISTACTTGLHCLGEGFKLIQRDQADVMVCGGTEAPLSPLGMGGFARMRALCATYNDTPEQSSRPFDKSRSGFVMSEGSAIVVLEELHHALNRGARIYAEVLGYGLSGDAYHISAPSEDGDGAFRCMEAAVKDAGVQPSEIGYINAHATSTPIGDKAEAAAISRLFSENKDPVLVSSCKGSVGHLLGAAGSLEAAMTALSCYHGIVPPTVNLEEPDVTGNFALVTVPNHPWNSERRVALSNSFGFGGTNATLCISNYTS